MIEQTKLSNNALAVMALASEYCRALELAGSTSPRKFTEKMVKLLPRIYMSVNDLTYSADTPDQDFSFGSTHLEEAAYNQVNNTLAALLGEDDTYLETFHEDMKYSDTPIGASIAEGLADIFQVLYNFVEDVREADVETTFAHLAALRFDFTEYWSQTLCNVMRPLNEICRRYETDGSDPDDDEPYSDEIDFAKNY